MNETQEQVKKEKKNNNNKIRKNLFYGCFNKVFAILYF